MKIAIMHRYPENEIKPTNAAFPYFVEELRKAGHIVEVKTFRHFNRLSAFKWLKSLIWIFYAPLRVIGREYNIIYCDDSFPYYAGLAKWVSPKSKVIKRMGDLHLMYYTSGILYKILHWFERWEWKAIDLLLPVSEAMQKVTGGQVVLDPIDLDDFKKPENYWGKWDIMFHGYLNKNKGLEILMEAAECLPQYKFCVVGDGPALESLVSPLNVDFICHWVEYKNIKYYLYGTEIGVALRSKNPGNEYVYTQPYLQYSACGKPVLVSERKVFKDYPLTFKDVNTLVIWIKKLLEDEESRVIWGKYCLERVQKHNAKLIAKELVNACIGGNPLS